MEVTFHLVEGKGIVGGEIDSTCYGCKETAYPCDDSEQDKSIYRKLSEMDNYDAVAEAEAILRECNLHEANAMVLV